MRILFDIGHPGHVHLYKYLYKELKERGHILFVSVRDIPIAKHLLEVYNMPYIDLGRKRDSKLGKAISVIQQDLKLYSFVRKHKIDYGISSGIVLAHLSKLTNMRSFMFDDDDDSSEPLVVKFGHPYSDIVFTPSSILRKSKKCIYYKGTHELAYLHPNRFNPDKSVLSKIGIIEGEKYFLLRFVAFKGHHDGGHYGINIEQKRQIIQLLLKFGKVLITSERPIEPEFEKYRLSIPPEDIHSLMYYASMFIGDSQTMISEAATLGLPAFKCNTFAGQLSVPNEIEKKYGLCFAYHPNDFAKFYNNILKVLTDEKIKEVWSKRQKMFLQDKIDVTAFIVWYIDNYPKSSVILKENPNLQNTFH
jgi:uncharacterized protein